MYIVSNVFLKTELFRKIDKCELETTAIAINFVSSSITISKDAAHKFIRNRSGRELALDRRYGM